MTDSITRASLTDAVYSEIGISYAESSKLIDIFFDELIDGIIRDKCAKISSFGSFYLKNKQERVGRNPKTKEEVIIAPRQVISFYASNILKEKINS